MITDKKIITDEQWRKILKAGVERNAVMADCDTRDTRYDGKISKRLIYMMKSHVTKHNEEWELTDLYMDPTRAADFCLSYQFARADISLLPNLLVDTALGVNVHKVHQLWEEEEYYEYCKEELKLSLPLNNRSLIVGLDLSGGFDFDEPDKYKILLGSC